jgi:translation elongation factor P
MAISTNQFKNGNHIEVDGAVFKILEFQHVKPGKGGAFVKTRIKSLVTGNVLDRTFRSGDKAEVPDVEQREMQYLYKEEVKYYFMDTVTYDQTFVPETNLGDAVNYLKDGMVIALSFYKGKAIGVELPNFVDLKVVQTEPGIKGDTAQNATKLAMLESGYTLQVPLFLEEGEVVKIDTRTGQYITRVSR